MDTALRESEIRIIFLEESVRSLKHLCQGFASNEGQFKAQTDRDLNALAGAIGETRTNYDALRAAIKDLAVATHDKIEELKAGRA